MNSLLNEFHEIFYLKTDDLKATSKEIEKWHFNDKIYGKIIVKLDFGKVYTIICKSRDYVKLAKEKLNISYHNYVAEIYTDKDFEINPIWENIYTIV